MHTHKHQCYKCKTVWQHPETCGGNDGAHLCPGCGQEYSFGWYKGPKQPDYIFVRQHAGLTKKILEANHITPKRRYDYD